MNRTRINIAMGLLLVTLVFFTVLQGCGVETSRSLTASPLVAISPDISPSLPEPSSTPRWLPRPSRSRPLPSPTSSRPSPRAARTHSLPVSPRGRSFARHVSATAYCTGHTTASGRPVHEGVAATLDRSIPFGTKVSTPMGVFTVWDRIGHSSDLDLFFDSCARAREFGRRSWTVTFTLPA